MVEASPDADRQPAALTGGLFYLIFGWLNKYPFSRKLLRRIVPWDVKMPGTGTKQEFGDNYQHYQKLGGIINESDYRSALQRAREPNALDRVDIFEAQKINSTIQQARNIARFSEIELSDSGDALDFKIVLYAILRLDTQPEGVRWHHSQMSDQRLFAEVLRMLKDANSLGKLTRAFLNISFQ